MNKSRPPGKLKQRVLTALFLLLLVIAAMVYLPSLWLAVVFGAFILFAGWEWAALSGFSATAPRLVYIVALGLGGAIGFWTIERLPNATLVVLIVAICWWIWAFFDLVRHPRAATGVFGSTTGKLFAGMLVLLPPWLAVIYLHRTDSMSPAVMLFLFAVVWIADTSAYFVGRAWGKTRLAPGVSPGKTVEGLVGALAAVIVVAYFCGTMIWKLQARMLFTWVVVAVLALFFSVLGDLVESKVKRLADMKDSGNWLPGHGGVLDRIDALTAAAPTFALGWMLFLRPEA
ncbi:MAG: phosphatidate cytidylyltransferase [Acidiferrobacterales bacterium]